MTKTKLNPATILEQPYARVLTPDPVDGGFVAEIKEFRGCFAYGTTPAAALKKLEAEAAEWIEVAAAMGVSIPPPHSQKAYSGKINLRMPKSLHQRAAEVAEREGVSLNQLLISAISASLGVSSGSRVKSNVASST